jgi:hypothetical protein
MIDSSGARTEEVKTVVPRKQNFAIGVSGRSIGEGREEPLLGLSQ